MLPSRHLKVFLCHSSGDKPTVRELYRQLNAEGWVDAWLDEIKLLPGQEWDMEIEKAVEEADVVIVCISTRSVDKEGYVQKELRYVLNIADEKPEGSIFVIPLKLDDCIVPRRLRAWQWVDYYPEDQKNVAYQRLLQSLKLRAARLGISFTKPGPSLHYMTSEEHSVVPNVVAPNEPEAFDISRKKQEEKIRNQHLNQTRYAPGKRKALLNPKLRLFIGVASILLLLPLCIMAGVNYISNNLFEFVNVTPTNQLSTRLVSDITEAASAFDTETAIAVSTEVLSPTPTLGIGSTMISEKDGMTLLYVPASAFTMGSDNGDSDEKPIHEVYLDTFWIDQTEITNKMYSLCVNAGNCKSITKEKTFGLLESDRYNDSKYGDYPVIYVDWEMAESYCQWVNRRLPTEAEWEKAARGVDGRQFPWGNNSPTADLLNSTNLGAAPGDTEEVGQYQSGISPYGVLDMAGNVLEWVADWYDESFYQITPNSNPIGPSLGQYRVLRGGSWSRYASLARSANRYSEMPETIKSDIGFRCAMSASP